jgi:hypothetical protein
MFDEYELHVDFLWRFVVRTVHLLEERHIKGFCRRRFYRKCTIVVTRRLLEEQGSDRLVEVSSYRNSRVIGLELINRARIENYTERGFFEFLIGRYRERCKGIVSDDQ